MNRFLNVKRGLAALALVSASALAGASAQAWDGKNRHVIIINDTSEYMTELYASNIHRNTWEENVLHGRIISPGASLDVNIYDGTRHCKFDLRAVFANGAETERDNANVCTAESWTITE